MAHRIDNSTVGSLDLQRYLGEWYEIARLDHGFEKGVSHAKAHYSIAADGSVRVVNSGRKEGKVKISRGRAKLTDTAGLLRVSFFWPFYADYRVMMVDGDYSYALVGSKDDGYLWILSRTPYMDYPDLREVIEEAKIRGYDTDSLIWVDQL